MITGPRSTPPLMTVPLFIDVIYKAMEDECKDFVDEYNEHKGLSLYVEFRRKMFFSRGEYHPIKSGPWGESFCISFCQGPFNLLDCFFLEEGIRIYHNGCGKIVCYADPNFFKASLFLIGDALRQLKEGRTITSDEFRRLREEMMKNGG